MRFFSELVLDESETNGQNIWKLVRLGSHKVGAYEHRWFYLVSDRCVRSHSNNT